MHENNEENKVISLSRKRYEMKYRRFFNFLHRLLSKFQHRGRKNTYTNKYKGPVAH